LGTDDPGQLALLTAVAEPPAVASGVAGARRDPAPYDTALTGDRYDWLTTLPTVLLPTGTAPVPAPPACDGCGQAMLLPAAAPVLWTCPACHPAEVSVT
jgi:hypothetical protein